MKTWLDTADTMKRRLLSWVVGALALIVIGIHNAAIRPWMPDDAFISFRYAESLASGHGLVFNPGERVEGFTSFLWVILLALGKRIGLDTVLLARLLSATCGIGAVLLLLNVHRFWTSIDRRIPLLAVLMLGSCGVFTPWARSGMEVTLFTFLVLLSALFYLSLTSDPPPPKGTSTPLLWGLCALGAVSAVTAMVRPEGCLILAALTAHYATSHWIRKASLRYGDAPRTAGGPPRMFAGVACLLGSFLVLYLPYFLLRYSYFGYLLPNTFYTKVGFHPRQVLRGLRYGMGFTTVAALIILPIVVWMLASSWNRLRPSALPGSYREAALRQGRHDPERTGPSTLDPSPDEGARAGGPLPGGRGELSFLVFLAAVWCAYVIAIGGDVLAAYRFFAPIMPILCLASAICAASIFEKRYVVPFVLAAVLYNLVQLNVGYGIHLHLVNDRVGEEGKEVGLWLRDHVPPDSVIAVNVAGSIPYYSELRTIDMLGLNDVHIAHRDVPGFGGGMPGHEKGDGAYVLSRAPTHIQFGGSLGSKEPVFRGDKEIDADPGFHDLYVLTSHPLPSGRHFVIYERRSAPSSPY